jgi:fructokinase
MIYNIGVENSYSRKFGNRLRMREIHEGYRSGNDACTDIFLQFIEDFGRCVGGLISTLDPDAVVIGGGLSTIDELYTLGVLQTQRFAFHHKFKTPVLKNHLGDFAGVFGAAWLKVEL